MLRRSPLEDLIGNTPLVRLGTVTRRLGVEVYGKLESRNPGGSVKDRAALAIVRDAEARGLLRPGGTLLDATSGNTGIAYAMLGAAKGFRVRLCVPMSASPERMRILRAYGARIESTPADEGSDGAIRRARELAAGDADAFYADQYNNAANWRAHYETTGREILQQTGGRITHFVAGLGTSGTLVGCSRRFKEAGTRVHVAAVQPDSPFHGLEGLKHMETAIVPGIYDATTHDAVHAVGTEEAQGWARRLAREEGLFVGVSSGAAVAAAARLAEGLDSGLIVAILPDGGERYLSDRFWETP